MQIVALDGTKLLALMAAGGIFALAGLWLMFRPQADGEAARVELFGLKFQASSAGVLVFLIGAVFLAVPIFVPEKPALTVRGPSAAAPSDSAVRSGHAGNAGERPVALQLPSGPDVGEQEPNDTISTANALDLGQTVSGSLAPGDIDWYVFSTESVGSGSIRVTFRNLGGGCPRYDMLNSVENLLYSEQVCDVSHSRTTFVDGPRHYLRVDARHYRTRYELLVSAD